MNSNLKVKAPSFQYKKTIEKVDSEYNKSQQILNRGQINY